MLVEWQMISLFVNPSQSTPHLFAQRFFSQAPLVEPIPGML
jgi:hypothetical protein